MSYKESNLVRNQRKEKFLSNMKPTQILALGFAVLILVGAILLTLPISAQVGRVSFIDALFTSTSAVCVTGLIVVNTKEVYSTFGHFIIMLLIQFGGLGIMTMATMVVLAIGRKISLKDKLLMQEALNTFSLKGLSRLVILIVRTTLIIEGIAALILTFRFLPEYGMPNALGLGMFHSVSAFCNAGFDLFGDSLVRFVNDPVINLVITSLIILGGIGFSVMMDVFYYREDKSLSLHTKIVLTSTIVLLVFGSVVFFTLEYSNPETMGQLSIGGKALSSYFLSVTPRTAGFNTVDTGSLTTATLFIVIILMFVGASPGSTAGGVKNTTMSVIMLSVIATITNKEDTNIFGRKLPKDVIRRAFAIVFIAALWVMLAIIILSITEGMEFMDVVFEVVSAFGTVGLSTGVTGALTFIGKIVIIVTMFIGRLGPMTLAVAFARQSDRQIVKYPEEQIVVG
ncbi:MAG: TrkH family potassium uptake protein [Clostridia bacterium]